MELEDDLFFADLSKQISLLIMDEDEDEDPLPSSPQQHHFQVYSYTLLNKEKYFSSTCLFRKTSLQLHFLFLISDLFWIIVSSSTVCYVL